MTYSRYKKKVEYKGPTRASINKSSLKGWVEVVSPYDARFVEDLKTVIQPSHRKWDPTLKVWQVNEIYLEELVGLLQMHYDEVVTDLGEVTPDNMFQPVFSVLPADAVDKVYKALANAVHPDHGGSNEMMTKLNQAYQEVKK